MESASSKTKLFCETLFNNAGWMLKCRTSLRDLIQNWHTDGKTWLQSYNIPCRFLLGCSGRIAPAMKNISEAYEVLYLPCKRLPENWRLQNVKMPKGWAPGASNIILLDDETPAHTTWKCILSDPLHIHHAYQQFFCNYQELLRLCTPASRNAMWTNLRSVPDAPCFNTSGFPTALWQRGAEFPDLNVQSCPNCSDDDFDFLIALTLACGANLYQLLIFIRTPQFLAQSLSRDVVQQFRSWTSKNRPEPSTNQQPITLVDRRFGETLFLCWLVGLTCLHLSLSWIMVSKLPSITTETFCKSKYICKDNTHTYFWLLMYVYIYIFTHFVYDVCHTPHIFGNIIRPITPWFQHDVYKVAMYI